MDTLTSMLGQPPAPRGWRYPIKSSEVATFFPGVDEAVWLGPPTAAQPGPKHETIGLHQLQPTVESDGGPAFRAVIRVLPPMELVEAREWLMSEVSQEVAEWLELKGVFLKPGGGMFTRAGIGHPSEGESSNRDTSLLLCGVTELNSRKVVLEIPRFIPQTKPTPPNHSDATGRRSRRFSDQADAIGPVRPFAPTSLSLGRGFDPQRPYQEVYT